MSAHSVRTQLFASVFDLLTRVDLSLMISRKTVNLITKKLLVYRQT
jgi:hypothetical protein